MNTFVLLLFSVRRTRGIGKPEMPPLPSSNEGIEVVVVPCDHSSLEDYHCPYPVKLTNPWVSDVCLLHLKTESNLCTKPFYYIRKKSVNTSFYKQNGFVFVS